MKRDARRRAGRIIGNVEPRGCKAKGGVELEPNLVSSGTPKSRLEGKGGGPALSRRSLCNGAVNKSGEPAARVCDGEVPLKNANGPELEGVDVGFSPPGHNPIDAPVARALVDDALNPGRFEVSTGTQGGGSKGRGSLSSKATRERVRGIPARRVAVRVATRTATAKGANLQGGGQKNEAPT